jgi:hypothetical protein
MLSNDIDLRKIQGSADYKIKIDLPTDALKPNIYIIESNMSDVSLNIFNDKVQLSKGMFNAIFDGDKVTLEGDCNINGFRSKLSLTQNIYDRSKEPSSFLKIRSTLSPTIAYTNHFEAIPGIQLLSGKAILDLEYKYIPNGVTVSAKSNLRNLGFNIPYLSLHKPSGVKADLEISRDLSSKLTKFKLDGDESLRIIGNLIGTENNYILNLNQIRSDNNDFSAIITRDIKNLKVNLSGSTMDASGISFKNLSAKGKLPARTTIKAELSKVMMQNNVLLNSLALDLYCDSKSCFKGNLDSEIRGGTLKVRITPQESYSLWNIDSNRIGSLCDALGIYNKIKAGAGRISFKLEPKQNALESFSIPEGNFILSKVVIVKMPFLTKILSFVSLPGFLNLITNNDNIRFAEIQGRFRYQDHKLIVEESNGKGSFFDFTSKGSIETLIPRGRFSGWVTPSFYVSYFSQIPIIGKFIYQAQKKALSLPYSTSFGY